MTVDWTTSTTILARLRDHGDGSAWGRLEDHFWEPLVRYALRLGLGLSDAQDVAQETLLAFARLHRADRYQRERGRLSSWLFGIANQRIREVRRSQLRQALVLSRAGETIDEASATDCDAEALWEEEWRRAAYREALQHVRSQVAEETFRLFELTVCQGLPVAEVARRLGVAPKQVYNARYRITTRLIRALERTRVR